MSELCDAGSRPQRGLTLPAISTATVSMDPVAPVPDGTNPPRVPVDPKDYIYSTPEDYPEKLEIQNSPTKPAGGVPVEGIGGDWRCQSCSKYRR